MTGPLGETLRVRGRDRGRARYWSEYDRETHTCWLCGSDSDLEVHHRDGDWLNNELINLVALCHHCHRAIHKRRNTRARLAEWKSSLQLYQSDNGLSLATDGGES